MPIVSLTDCAWPPLPAPFDAALRDAVRFILAEIDALGIIAAGTIVRGEGHANSDLDLYVIHAASYRRRVQRLFRGVPAEIFINPPHAVRAYFAEEHVEGRPLTAHMLATGFVVHAGAPVVEQLRSEAREWLRRPTILSEAEVLRARYAIATRLEDGADVVHVDEHTATMLLTQAVASMLEFHCQSRLGRIPRAKELLATIDADDPQLGQRVAAFFEAATAAERLNAAEALADRIIGMRRFFEWDSGPEAFPLAGRDADPRTED